MHIDLRKLGIELTREGHAYVEYAVFDALRQFAPRIDRVNVCLRRSGPDALVTCVMVAELRPSGRAVAILRAGHPYAAIDRTAAELRDRIEHERADAPPPQDFNVSHV
jgi:hypothetical protein